MDILKGIMINAKEEVKKELESSKMFLFFKLLTVMNMILEFIDLVFEYIDKYKWQNKQEVLDFVDSLNERSVRY